MSSNILDIVDTSSPSSILSSVVTVMAASALAYILHDYRSWILFGTGGTPPTPSGYYKIRKLGVLQALYGSDLTDSSKILGDGPSYLTADLPVRSGQAPKLTHWTLPQRQIPLPIDEGLRARLDALASKYGHSHPELLILDKSITEGRTTDAIYARPELPGRAKATHDKVLGNEIGHVHPQDGSMHVWLTKSDARTVVQKGWGLRFPLASLGMCDNGWVFVYAPQNEKEVDICEEIMRAGIGHLTGVKVEG